jgi:threonylcarbamoyladenosine tRNA methylthiotransferase MtaB
MPQTAREVVKDRARRLREKGAAALSRHLDAQVGRTRRVLAESVRLGRSEHFALVGLNAPVESGMIVDVTIKGHDGRQLLAA